MPYLGTTPSSSVAQTSDLGDDTVTEAKMANDAIGLAEMKAGTDGNIISYDASGNPVAIATGSDGQVLTSTGAGSPPAFEAAAGGFTLATEQATTSGTSVTFGSIPAGTKLILVMFEGMGFSASVNILVTIGDSGGLETSGYVSTSTKVDGASPATVNSTAAFIINYDHYTRTTSGIMTLALKDSSNFTWISSHATKNITDNTSYGGGDKSLSAELTQVSISGGTFDEGSINIMYQ